MTILENHPLQAHNTFGIAAHAEKFAVVESEADVLSLLGTHSHERIRILGGGSNILLTDHVDGLLIKNEIKGIQILDEDEVSVRLVVGGGENWHGFVMHCVGNGYGGVENLSLIPGTVGAAPIQNIGAYGVELKDVFVGLYAIDLELGERVYFPSAICAFGYRDSIFKREMKGKIIITQVVVELRKAPHHLPDTSYGAIRSELEKKGLGNPSIKDVSDTVISIRQSKLPDPKTLGNSGSFFKNPELPMEDFEAVRVRFPGIPSYPMPGGLVKIPAAWLIDRCGFKGRRHGGAGCYEKQPLVLVNYGDASGAEIWAFAQKVQEAVWDRFGVRIVPEVNVW